MAKEKPDGLKDYKPVYVIEEKAEDGRLLARGKFKHGMLIKGVKHLDFEMVEALSEDNFNAEKDASANNVLTFNGALMALQLRKVGTFDGPFTLDLIGRLKPGDYNRLRAAQMELDVLGEGE